jgi:OmcA/MtrC family decaheme c-type cytochrome
VHGENRNQIQTCVICHNASETDIARRRVTPDEAERNRPAQAIDMAVMIHKIHTGERMHEFQRDYTVIGFGGTVHPFDEVRYPVLRKNGQPADTSVCTMCHVNGSEGLPLANEQTRPQQVDPQGPLNPVGRITAACTSCHQSLPAASHALANTTELGESCSACHGQNSQFSVQRVHAR